MSLFQNNSPSDEAVDKSRPLADRMRPRTLDEFVGQEHILGPGKSLRVQIERDDTGSLIFWGPPGVGKTTLAKIIARMTQADFIEFSAVLSGIKEIKQVMADAERARQYGTRTIVFVDEVHRFNKAQQDAFLPYVEKGSIRLIGATTENPSFEIISALLSRCRVYILKPLSEEQIVELLQRALKDEERGLGDLHLEADETALRKIAAYSSGDARSAYNVLDVAATLATEQTKESTRRITDAIVTDALQKRVLRYDKAGRRALQPDLGAAQERAQQRPRRRSLLAGTDVGGRRRPFVCRSAGGANGRGRHWIGRSECARHHAWPLAMLSIFSASRKAIWRWRRQSSICARHRSQMRFTPPMVRCCEDVERTAQDPVPLHLRNAVTGLMKAFGYGEGYQYAHDQESKVADMQCLPDNLKDRVYYHPTEEGIEKRIKARLEEIRKIRRATTD